MRSETAVSLDAGPSAEAGTSLMTSSRANAHGFSARSLAELDLAEVLYQRAGEAAPEPRLKPTLHALAVLGNPHLSYRTIHVTGTNGKTSTSRIAESVLRAHGLRTGLYTSPDLGHINERINVAGIPVPASRLLEHWDSAVAAAVAATDAKLAGDGQPPLTFFEALTVLGLYVFATDAVDVAVVEVGMGGTWDATNVVHADVAVLTPIGLDHTDRLGPTIELIARAKSGIITPGATIVSAAQTPAAATVIRDAAAARGARMILAEGDGFAVLSREQTGSGQRIDVAGTSHVYNGLPLRLRGPHQAQNAAVAVAAAEAMLDRLARAVDPEAIRRGVSTATAPGRMQRTSSSPVTILDAAHNPAGVAATIAALGEEYQDAPLIVVVGVLREKDTAGMLRLLAPSCHTLVVTTAPSPRAVPAAELADAARRWGADPVTVEDPVEAIHRAQTSASRIPGSVVVVLGSITLTGLALETAGCRHSDRPVPAA